MKLFFLESSHFCIMRAVEMLMQFLDLIISRMKQIMLPDLEAYVSVENSDLTGVIVDGFVGSDHAVCEDGVICFEHTATSFCESVFDVNDQSEIVCVESKWRKCIELESPPQVVYFCVENVEDSDEDMDVEPFIVGHITYISNGNGSSAKIVEAMCDPFDPRMYSEDLCLDMQLDASILEELVAFYMPELLDHIGLNGLQELCLVFARCWFSDLFSYGFQKSTSMSLIAAIVANGEDYVFAIVMAILQVTEDALLEQERDLAQALSFLELFADSFEDVGQIFEIANQDWNHLQETISIVRTELLEEMA